jgi:hypothetical protein
MIEMFRRKINKTDVIRIAAVSRPTSKVNISNENKETANL